MIEYADFQKIEMRVGVIEDAKEVEGSKKLLKLTVDTGDRKRTVVAGIKERYSPEELKGMKVIVITNLKPRKIFGIESEGMLLATESISLLTPDPRKECNVGERIF